LAISSNVPANKLNKGIDFNIFIDNRRGGDKNFIKVINERLLN
jgi:hypothetical protein